MSISEPTASSLALSFPSGKTLFQTDTETSYGKYTVTLSILDSESVRLSRIPNTWYELHGSGVLEITETPHADVVSPSPLSQIAQFTTASAAVLQVKTDWVPSEATNRAYFGADIIRIPPLLREHGFGSDFARSVAQAIALHTPQILGDSVSITVETSKPQGNGQNIERHDGPNFPPICGRSGPPHALNL